MHVSVCAYMRANACKYDCISAHILCVRLHVHVYLNVCGVRASVCAYERACLYVCAFV